ncbi:HzsA-related protein [Paraglaciecola psychrophila]|nr:hypothetical protein [Paraglaciecola psychrophila]
MANTFYFATFRIIFDIQNQEATMKHLLLAYFIFCIFEFRIAQATPALDYDIIYVRYPAEARKSPFVNIPQGEKAYVIEMGADLVLHKKDGSELILVDCKRCSVMDPMMSFDGTTVYYSLNKRRGKIVTSWIYKMHLKGPSAFKAIRLTFDDGFDSKYYAANTTEEHYQSHHFGIRDMAPVPLADGRILFTSNRSGLTAFDSLGYNPYEVGSVQQLYVMSDHEGSDNNKFLSNIERLEAGTLHLAQHPMQLSDGRILFTTWQDVADKYQYGMSSLFTVHPDGSNLQQFTEPHDKNKFLDHFITQLSDSTVVSAYYYPSFDYGFGVLWRAPLESVGPDFLRFSNKPEKNAKGYTVNRRGFERKGTVIITPHSTPRDIPSPGSSGKYSMPSATKDNGLLVAYSKGSVNHFGAVCKKRNLCESLKSGIYLIDNANKNIINSPNQLVKIVDSPDHNEIWPRAVLPYNQIYGIPKPNILPSVDTKTEDDRLARAEPASIVGTSSMYNRDKLSGNSDPFQSKSSKRELHDGNWTVNGAEAGVFTNSDIYAVRIIGTPPKPFTKVINKYQDNKRWKKAERLIGHKNYEGIVERYGSYHMERWEILGEFPLNYKSVPDNQGNPDSSWAAKIPADTPFLIQTLDKNGMTLNSELTWRALKPGEARTDCGGCHAHAIEPLEFSDTFAGMRVPIQGVSGTEQSAPDLMNGLWDLTKGEIPLLNKEGVEYIKGAVVGVEFNRDVKPILKNNCSTCHTKGGSGGSFVLDGSNGRSVWETLSDNKRSNGKKFIVPQKSKYIRVPQARQSLLTWVVYGERLDGRTNESRKNDIDFPVNHPSLNLSDKDKRTVARWIDLGGPIDFPQTDGMGYTDDNQLPVVTLKVDKEDEYGYTILIGAIDVHSGINWSSLNVTVEQTASKSDKSKGLLESILDTVSDETIKLNGSLTPDENKVVTLFLPGTRLRKVSSFIVKVYVEDLVGNKNVTSKRMKIIN